MQDPHGRRGWLMTFNRLDCRSLLMSIAVAWMGTVSMARAENGAAVEPAHSLWQMPLMFEELEDGGGRFMCRGTGYGVFVSPGEAAIILNQGRPPDPAAFRAGRGGVPGEGPRNEQSVIRLKLRGSNQQPQAAGLEEVPTRLNYLLGNDPNRWRRSKPAYSRVRYAEVYPEIDLVYYGNQRQLEFDFVVRPGGDPAVIQLDVTGSERVEIDAQGDLVMHTAAGPARQRKPVVYQDLAGHRRQVTARYVVSETEIPGSTSPRWTVGFAVGQYDQSKPLVIDPVLVYSGLLGGSGNDVGWSVAVDSGGNTVVVGTTLSLNFPVTNALYTNFSGNPTFPPNAPPRDVFVAKIDPSGTNLIFSTFLGGTQDDAAYAVALDSADNIYLAGQTDSTNFPVTLNALSTNIHGTNILGYYAYDAFMTKLDASGSTLLYSSYLGGTNTDVGVGVAVDDAREVYVTGFTASPDFEFDNSMTGFFGGEYDAFLMKLSAVDRRVFYTVLWGGDADDRAQAVAVDPSHSAVVVGITDSYNFPVTGAFQTNYGGGDSDAFVTKWAPNGTNQIYSTYLGGYSADTGLNVAVDAAGRAFATGATASLNFPTNNALFRTNSGLVDAFVTELDPTGSTLVYSTYFGGTGVDEGWGIALGPDGSAYIAGNTTSTNLAITGRIQNGSLGLTNVLVFGLAPAGAAVQYSVALGGFGSSFGTDVALDADGNALVTGVSGSPSFPLLPSTNGLPHGSAATNAILAKIHPGALTLSAQAVGANGVAVTWPALFQYYAPQSINVIPATNLWTTLTNPPAVIGTNLVLVITNTTGNSFFRLAPRP